MAGKIKYLIDCIIASRAQGNEVVAQATKTKLILKGISPDHYTDQSDDDPKVIERLQSIAEELGLPV